MSDGVEAGLASPDPEERRRAVASLHEAPEASRARLFVAALGDPDWRVRKEAVGMARALSASRDVLDALVLVLGPGDNVGQRNAAVEALGCFGSRAVEALGDAIPELDADGRKLAAEALARSEDAHAIGVLAGMLDDPDINVRCAVIDAIAAIGGADVDRAAALLQRCLVTDDTLTALGALQGLNRLGIAVAWPMLRPHLGNPVLGETALVAAGFSGHPDALPSLLRALERSSGRSFETALGALAAFVSANPVSLRAARSQVRSLGEKARRLLLEHARGEADSLDVQRYGLLVAGALGTAEAADAVIDALSDDRVAAEAHRALDMLGPAAVLALARRARTGPPHERAACVEQLGELAEESMQEVASQAILDATEDGAPEVVRAALVALSRIGDEATLTLAARWLSPEASPAIRQAAASALAATAPRYPEAASGLARSIRPDEVSAGVAAILIGALPGPVRGDRASDVEFLAEAASNESPIVRRAALDALARFGAPQAVEAAAFGLTDEAPEVQLAAVRALGRMRDDAGRAVGVGHLLESVRTFSDDALGTAAIAALGETADPDALDVLRSVAREGTPMRAVAAVEALGNIDAPERIDALIHALSHPESEVVKAALRAVAREERDPRGALHVGACLDHEAWDVRRLAAELLGHRGDPAAKHLLRQRLIGEREALVREEIQRSLSDGDGSTLRRTVPPLGGGMG